MYGRRGLEGVSTMQRFPTRATTAGDAVVMSFSGRCIFPAKVDHRKGSFGGEHPPKVSIEHPILVHVVFPILCTNIHAIKGYGGQPWWLPPPTAATG